MTNKEEEKEASLRVPLLSKDDASSSNPGVRIRDDDHIITTANSDSQDSSYIDSNSPVVTENASAPSAALLGCYTLAIVLVGLALVVLVSFFPFWIFLVAPKMLPIFQWKGILVVIVLDLVHLRALWVSPSYLALMRFLVLPIRRLLLPLVPSVARIESIREQETTQYYKVVNERAPEFRRSVRKHYRRMEKIFQRGGIQHRCIRAETSLVLRDVIPIIYEHQKRCTNSSYPIDDFIKRALVVTVVPDGILDLYYNPQQELVCLQFSILQGNVWHWFMYLCRDSSNQAGIWWHGALLAIHRGHALEKVDWVNAQMHQKDSKRHAGYEAAAHLESETLAQIYPWSFTQRIPEETLNIRLWDAAPPPS